MHRNGPFSVLRIAQVALATFVLWIMAFQPAAAQNAQGTIVGHVTDPSGAVVVGATVTVTNIDTGVKLTFKTNSNGDYVAPALNPGKYSLSVNASGFSTAQSNDLVLEVQQTLRQNFDLKVGSVSNTVEVSASSQMLHTDDQTIGQVLHADMIENLPINGRDFTNLMITNVGTNITEGGSGTDWAYHGLNTAYQEVSSNGTQAQSTSYSLDGIYDADYFFSVPINIPNELAIQEFKMMNGMYGAEYGQGAAQVNVDIKSGTNHLHGAAYWALEGQWLQPNSKYQEAVNAANPANPSSVNPPFHQNQFGGTLGGPFTIPHVYNGKDKTFWFLSYDEGLFARVNNPSSDFVPTAAELSGDFSAWPFPIYDPSTTAPNPNYNPNPPKNYVGPDASPIVRQPFPGNKIPSNRIDAISAKLAAFFDGPNVSSCDESNHMQSACFNYSADTETTRKQGVGTGRIDQYFGNNDHIYLTANWGVLSQINTSIRAGQGGQVYQRPKLFGGTWAHTFSPNFLNQFTLGYSRDHFLNGPNTAYGPNLSAQVGLANTNVNPATFDLPQVSIFNYQGFGGGEPTTYADNIYQLVDGVTLVRGRHTLNFGADIRRIQLFELDNYLGTGSLNFNGEFTALVPGYAGNSLGGNGSYSATAPYEGNALADFLLGQTSSVSNPPPIATDNYILWGNNWNLYVQDDYHATGRLTLNAGLRWERPANYHSRNADGYAFNPNNGGQFVWANCAFTKPILAAGGNPNFLQCGASNTLVPVDNKDFAPRVGFAYRPQFSDKFVVRGGFGIFYGLYNRYYDGSQFDKNALYNESAASVPSPSGTEAQSTAVVSQMWLPPVNADQLFVTPGWEFPFNQVNWPTNHTPYDEQWSLDTEYSLTSKLMLDIGYVGDHGLRQPSQDILGVATPPTVAGDPCNSIVDASVASSSCLNDPNFQPIDTREPYANMPPYLYGNRNGFQSSYNGLQVQLIQREVRGLTYHVNYTYSKTMDLTSGINLINGEPGLIQDPQHPYQMYGLAASDQTHHLVATYSYLVPKNLFHLDRGMDWLVAGWTASGVYQIASGFPFAINAGESADQMGEYYASRILANSTFHNSAGFKSSLGHWFDTSKYSTPALGRYGNTNKSPERTPYYTNLDANFGKSTQLFEGTSLLVRADFFNLGSTWHSTTVFNDYLFPDATVTDSNFGSLINPNYGTASLWNPRIIQLTAQFTF
jgi:hypothetical protein